jgi:hypothetical protein
LLADTVGLAVLSIRRRRSLEAENLVLRRQLALFKERGIKPGRIDAATRASLALLSRWCDWLLPDRRSAGNGDPLAPRWMATAVALSVRSMRPHQCNAKSGARPGLD